MNDASVADDALPTLAASPIRRAVLASLIDGARPPDVVADRAACTVEEARACLLDLRRAGYVEDGAQAWSLTARGRRLHADYVDSLR